MINIEEILFGDLEELPEDGFKVTDMKSANWVIARIKAAADRINEREMVANEYINKINEWLKKENEKDEKNMNFLKDFLEPWVHDKIYLQKNKSINLFGCKLGFRKMPPKVEFKDGYDIVEEAKKHGIPTKIKEYVNLKDVKDYIKKNKTIPEFVYYEENREKFYIKIGGENEIQGANHRLEK